jgi:hypothetical protein
MGLDIQYQYFLTGNTYKIINKVWSKDRFYYMIENDAFKLDPFDENEFKEYFHTIAEIRKNKLLKLKKSIIE